MNRKVIKSIVKSKLNKWLKSIKDEEVRKLAAANTILTGGAIASLLLSEDVKDFDLYFRDKKTTLAVADYYVKEFNSKHEKARAEVRVIDPNEICQEERVKILITTGVAAESSKENILNTPFEDAVEALEATNEKEAAPEEDYRPIFLSSNAITLSGKIQLVVRFFGEPEVIHKNYDFVHCTNYYDNATGELTLHPAALESLLTKELKYVGSKYPVCSVIRTRKFIKRGFTVNAGQYLKMLFQVSELDLGNITVLEDQLVGVDSAYFLQVIHNIKEKQEKDPSFEIDCSYLVSIIDKIF